MDGVNWSPAVRPGAWAAVDVGLLRHRKLAALRGRADVLYLACVLHCADELTDGRVRQHAVRRLLLEARARRVDFNELVAAGLLADAQDGDGWDVVGYLEWNPPRSYWDRKRAQSAQRQQRWREARREAKGPANRHGSTEGNALQEGGSNALRNAGDVTKDKERSSRALAGQPCPDCGQTIGRGHLETCPRMPRTVEHEHNGGEPPRPAPSHGVPSGGSRTLDELIAALRAT